MQSIRKYIYNYNYKANNNNCTLIKRYLCNNNNYNTNHTNNNNNSNDYNTIRTRYAPSPTGELHLGGLRTALYNYLLAKKNHQNKNGEFVLRIEDTDQARCIDGSGVKLEEILNKMGIICDESPLMGGPYGPYIQSERLKLYQKYAWQLVKEKKAYICFCDNDRLQRLRDNKKRKGEVSLYDRFCLGLTDEEISEKLKDSKQSYVIRLLISDGITRFHDELRGPVIIDNMSVDDQILLKSDGFPTYHLASVIDDHYMKISHVIRGEEWLPSTVKHVQLYKYFGWKMPKFVHLPLLLDENKQKLSKRDGHSSVESLLEFGYLPEAIINFVSLLGWKNNDQNKELFTMKELKDEFSLRRLQKSSAVVSIDKLNWTNSRHIRLLADHNFNELINRIHPLFIKDLQNYKDIINLLNDKNYLGNVVKTLLDKVIVLPDFVKYGRCFYIKPNYESGECQLHEKKCLKHDINSVISLMNKFRENLIKVNANSDHSNIDINKVVKLTAKEMNVKVGNIMQPLRYALTGSSVGGKLVDIVSTLGIPQVLIRLEDLIKYMQSKST